MAARRGRTAVVAGVLLLIVSICALRLGTGFRGRLYVRYYSYFSDIVLPIYVYFAMFMTEARVRFLRDWRLKAVLVFGVVSLAEVLRAFGVPLLGRTFGPLDFAVFAGGALPAVLADRFHLERLLPRRPPEEKQRPYPGHEPAEPGKSQS